MSRYSSATRERTLSGLAMITGALTAGAVAATGAFTGLAAAATHERDARRLATEQADLVTQAADPAPDPGSGVRFDLADSGPPATVTARPARLVSTVRPTRSSAPPKASAAKKPVVKKPTVTKKVATAKKAPPVKSSGS
jgi:hypothetical protein